MKANFTGSYFKIQSNALKNSLDEAKNNILAISKEKEFQNYITNNKIDNGDLKNIFYSYVSSKNEILQLRYIDINGVEKVRIQKYDNKNSAEIIFGKKLQNKKEEVYFTKTINLEKNQFFISNFNLNKELGKIQIPIQPTLRISTPIFDRNNLKKGILILNINILPNFNKNKL